MTTNIDSLPAGRELDALVAEKVMGWKFYLETRGDYTHVVSTVPGRERMYRIDTSRPIGHAGIDRHKHIATQLDAYRPSTDIAAAWEVFAKIPGIGEYGVAIERDPDGSYAVIRQDSVYVYISGGGGAPEFETLAQGNTAPLAICRAALRTVGV